MEQLTSAAAAQGSCACGAKEAPHSMDPETSFYGAVIGRTCSLQDCAGLGTHLAAGPGNTFLCFGGVAATVVLAL